MSKIKFGSLSRYLILSPTDMKNLEASEGNHGSFTNPPDERSGYVSRHFDNINDLNLWKFFNGIESSSDVSGECMDLGEYDYD